MLQVVIRNMKDLEAFYNERRRAYVFEDNIEEVIFEDNRELNIIPSKVFAPNAYIYIQHEDVSLRGTGIKAKAISSTNLYVEGDIEVTVLNGAHIECSGRIETDHISVYTVRAKEIISNTVFATEIYAEQIEANTVKADLLEYTSKYVLNLKVKEFIKNVKNVYDLKEFYNSIRNIYEVPENVITITYNGDTCLHIGHPLYAEYTSLEINKLIAQELICYNIYSDYINCERIKSKYIDSQVIIAYEINCENTIKCGYAQVMNLYTNKIKSLLLEVKDYRIDGPEPFSFDITRLEKYRD